MNRFDQNRNPRWDPDALVDFELFPRGRATPVSSGYRPHYQVRPDYLTSVSHFFIEVESVAPGESAEAFVKFLTPEAYPGSLREGQKIEVSEGSRAVGKALIKRIYNTLLMAG